MSDIGIVVMIFNRKDATQKCLRSIAAEVPASTPVVVMDDCSSDGAQEIADTFADRFIVKHLKTNVGLCRSANIGFDIAWQRGAKNLIRLNNDVVLKSGWFNGMQRALEVKDPGIISPAFHLNPHRRIWPHQRLTATKDGMPRRVDFLAGHCLMITEIMFSLGFRWEERFYPVGPCDDDACFFSLANCLNNYVADAAVCEIISAPHSLNWHKVSYRECFGDGWRLLNEKWGVLIPRFTKFCHEKMALQGSRHGD
jgi:glycosyltransferase involved in cell wall biosynthesis